MAKKMLIDAAHPEETRVAVLDGSRVEDFDFEVASRKQLRGNIYLAKVTRVEPSLQAAFVEYGGNRHGFLAFSEIHPDYYAIPHADQEAIKAELAAAEADSEGEDEDQERELPDERVAREIDVARAEEGRRERVPLDGARDAEQRREEQALSRPSPRASDDQGDRGNERRRQGNHDAHAEEPHGKRRDPRCDARTTAPQAELRLPVALALDLAEISNDELLLERQRSKRHAEE